MKNNEKILYTKYSNDRAKEFRILTQIIDDGTKRFVRKKAWNEEAKSHIKNMVLHEKSLSEMFLGTNFVTNRIIAHGEDFVDFEYTEGTGFDKILDGFLKKNDEDGFRKAVSDFFAELDKIATAEFHQNEKTIEVFGENTFVEGEKAIPAGNIDLIFQNVIVDSNGKWNVIDYEWTFDFAIPIKYLKWRSLYNLSVFYQRCYNFLFENKGFVLFGFSDEEREKYKKIETQGFQASVSSGFYLGLRIPYLLKRIYNPYLIEQNSDCIDVFYDTGNGFSESEKDVFYDFPLTIQPPRNLRALRIDPSCKHCFVSGVSIKSGEKELDFTTNAFNCTNGVFFFNTTDPQIYVDISGHEKSNFFFNMKVFALDETCSATIAEQNATIAEQNATIETLRSLSIKMQNSLSWKITSPLRLVDKIFRNH